LHFCSNLKLNLKKWLSPISKLFELVNPIFGLKDELTSGIVERELCADLKPAPD
jgi:hypothetical protein